MANWSILVEFKITQATYPNLNVSHAKSQSQRDAVYAITNHSQPPSSHLRLPPNTPSPYRLTLESTISPSRVLRGHALTHDAPPSETRPTLGIPISTDRPPPLPSSLPNSPGTQADEEPPPAATHSTALSARTSLSTASPRRENVFSADSLGTASTQRAARVPTLASLRSVLGAADAGADEDAAARATRSSRALTMRFHLVGSVVPRSRA